jgi:hypothetical protein
MAFFVTMFNLESCPTATTTSSSLQLDTGRKREKRAEDFLLERECVEDGFFLEGGEGRGGGGRPGEQGKVRHDGYYRQNNGSPWAGNIWILDLHSVDLEPAWWALEGNRRHH